ncbi:MAG: NFACT family protein, partial [Acetatifactor sp.]|nr:NFACT family protein [Acetatifactor sp.]
MAFDGVTIAAIVKELNDTCLGGRLYKIAQPESDELLLTIKTASGQRRLLLSADASLPLVYLTDQNKPSPMTAPGFCMLLRKHLQNGRITAVTQPGLERIIHICVEHLDEMGDLCHKTLIVEIMGKHSNIIFCNEDGMILDSIKHVSGLVSSLREVLPGKPYFVAQTQDKLDPLTCDREQFLTAMTSRPAALHKAIYLSYTGISPILAQEVCHRSGLDGDSPTAAFSAGELEKAFHVFREMMDQVQRGNFSPAIAYTGRQPVEYAALPLTLYSGGEDTLRPC